MKFRICIVDNILTDELPYVLNEIIDKLDKFYPTITLQSHGNIYTINKNDIVYAEVFYHTTRIYNSLNNLQKELNSNHFLRISKFYLVNINKMINFKDFQLILLK